MQSGFIRGIPVTIRFARIANALFVALLLGLGAASAEPCHIRGPRYNLVADTVHWSMEIRSGHSCTRGLRFTNVVIQGVKLVSRPQFGQIALLGSGFTYFAGVDVGGKDSFALTVVGEISKKFGTSTIQVTVSVIDPPRELATARSVDRPPAPAAKPPSLTPWPDATNTGIQAGTHLVAASSNTISQPGTYSGLIFTGPVLITASNVTLVNCLINMTPGDGYGIAVQGNSLTNVVIQNCEIAGNGPSGSGETYGIVVQDADGGGTATGPSVTINGNNIHDVGAGIEVEQSNASVIENNYIHVSTSTAPSGDHIDGIFYDGGSGGGGGAHGNNPNFSLLIQGNTVINSGDQTDAIFVSTLFGSVNDVTINNNQLAGGDYTIYMTGNAVGGSPTNVTITNNALGTGQYGYLYTDLWNGSGVDGNVVSGNVDYGTSLAAAVPVSPIVSEASAPAGNYSTGNKLTLTLYTSEVVTVSGTPTLTLNDGGTATYTGGTGTNALTFSYTVATGQTTSALAVTAVNGTIADLDGNALSTSNLPANFTGVSIDTP
jgi:hypothetical protein